MAVYVDPLGDFGWKLRGHSVQNCHMFCDEADLAELHEMALRIGMKTQWFQDHPRAPHYDLTPSRRALAVAHGAIEVDRKAAVLLWNKRRDLLVALQLEITSNEIPQP